MHTLIHCFFSNKHEKRAFVAAALTFHQTIMQVKLGISLTTSTKHGGNRGKTKERGGK